MAGPYRSAARVPRADPRAPDVSSGLMQAGNALARAGEATGDIGRQWARARNEKAVMEAEAQWGEFQIEIEDRYRTDTDFETINERIERDIENRVEALGEGITSDRVREAFTLRLKADGVRTKTALLNRAREREGDSAVAALDRANATFLKEVSAGRLTNEQAQERFLERTAGAAEAGWITQTDAERRAQAFGVALQDGEALRLIEADPQAAIEALGPEGKFIGLGEGRRLELKSRAEVVVRMDAAEARRIRNEREQMTRDMVGLAVGYIGAGLPVPPKLMEDVGKALDAVDNPLLADRIDLAHAQWDKRQRDEWEAERRADARETRTDNRALARLSLDDLEDKAEAGFALTPDEVSAARELVSQSDLASLTERYNTILQSAGDLAEAQFATPAEIQAEISRLQQEGSTPEDARRLDAFRSSFDRMQTQLRTDPINYVGRLFNQEQPVLDPAASKAADFQQREGFAGEIERRYGQTAFFRPYEKAAFSQLVERGTGEEIAGFVANLRAGAGSEGARRALRELGVDAPGFAQLGLLSLNEGSTGAALQGFNGLAILRDSKIQRSQDFEDDRLSVASNLLGDALPPSMTQETAALMEAADAIYAAREVGRGGNGQDLREKLYREALEAAAGKTARGGGIGKINGREFILPPHMDEDGVEDLQRSMTLDGLSALSYGGGVPAHDTGDGLKPVRPAEISKLRLVTVGQSGLYQLETRAGATLTDSATGKAYVLDLRNEERVRDISGALSELQAVRNATDRSSDLRYVQRHSTDAKPWFTPEQLEEREQAFRDRFAAP